MIVIIAFSILASSFTVGNFDYESTGNEATLVSGNCPEANTELNIPSTINHEGSQYSVTKIGNNAFKNCATWSGPLNLPSSLKEIGNNAFYFCSKLTGDINIPNGVTSIGFQAFIECTGFDGKFIIPETVTSIGGSAFSGCSSLTGDLIIPSKIRNINITNKSRFNWISIFPKN